MNYKQIFVLTLFCVTLYAEKVEEDDFDGVSIEDEGIENIVVDVPYESPVITEKNNVYLAEHFDDPNKVDKKWIKSQAKKEGIAEEISKYDGLWKVETPSKDALPGDLGLVLKSKAKHAAISAKLDRPFVFAMKPLIVQYEVILQEGQECGGAYLKLLSDAPENRDLKLFHDKTPYSIMFGPDKCGNDHKLHFIFRHKNPLNGTLEEKHCRKPKDRLEDYYKDKLPHLYTLIIRPDDTYEIWIDKKIMNSGSLLEDFTPPVNPPAEIDDPTDRKPEDWDEREKIPDPEAKKPDDWDESAPAEIVNVDAVKPDGWLEEEEPSVMDPEAVQPADWDADMDGEWEAPLIDNPKCKDAVGCGKWEAPKIPNPEYKGKWRPPYIDNPNYKGKWRPRRIPNPDYFEDKHPFKMQTISAVGFELWSMTENIYFDNLIITDELSVAEKWAAGTFDLKRKKIAKDSATFWGRMMKAMNYKPGWWALYFVYCAIPVVIYIWYLRKRVMEESFIQRMVMYTEERPWLWVVYVLVIGLPLVLIVYCCCKSSPEPQDKEEKEEYDAAHVKKTDAETKDDGEEEEPTPRTKEDLEKEVSEEEDKDEESEEKEDIVEKEASDKEENVVPEAQGDVPRKRKVRKD